MTIQQAQSLLQEGRTEEALEILSGLLLDQPDLVGAHMLSAAALNRLGQYTQSVGHLDRCVDQIDKAAKPAMARFNIAQHYLSAGAFDKAERLISEATDYEWQNPEFLYKLGQTLARHQRWSAALDCYVKAMPYAQNSPELFAAAGIAAHQSGDEVKGIENYKASLKLHGDHPSVSHNLIMALMNQGRPEEALIYCDEWLGNHPEDIEAMSFKTLLAHETGASDAADTWLNFERYVKTKEMAAPEGYQDIEAFNRALEQHVLAFPDLKTPPRDDPRWHHEALKIGTAINQGDMGPIETLEKLMHREVEAYITAFQGQESQHPFLMHWPKDYDIHAWAAVLEGEGNQDQHIHISGYLSGCYYVTIPQEVARPEVPDDTVTGGFRMGPPPSEISVSQPFPEKRIRPYEGLMVLFPAYLYHGTIPFKSDQRRISIAFDVLPKR